MVLQYLLVTFYHIPAIHEGCLVIDFEPVKRYTQLPISEPVYVDDLPVVLEISVCISAFAHGIPQRIDYKITMPYV